MTVLVTDLTNPIGQFILELACAQGVPARALLGPSLLERPLAAAGAELIPGTIEDDAALARATRGVDIIYHTAQIPQGTPAQLHAFNAEGTRRVLEACAGGIGRFVLLSSPAVYASHPTPDTWPIPTDAPREAHGIPALLAYGRSIIAAEDYVLEAHRRYAMDYTILRPTRLWESSTSGRSIVKTLMSTPDRADRLDESLGPVQWVHGFDAARAALLAGAHPDARNQAFIVAAPYAFNCHDILSLTWDITRPTQPNPFEARAKALRPVPIKLEFAKIRQRLGFEPVISLRQTLEEMVGVRKISPATFGAGRVDPVAPAVAEPVMAGRTCVVTGATSGLGLATAHHLAGMGARLILLGRTPAKGDAVLKALRAKFPAVDATMLYADLSLLGEVRRIVPDILAAAPRIDVLINNAGAIYDQREVTTEGFERTFATSYLSQYVMTRLLLDRLKASAPARVVTVTSLGHQGAQLDFDDLQNERVKSGMDAYTRAKLCNILFTRALAQRLAGSGVIACSIAPGFVASALGEALSGPLGAWMNHMKQNRSVSPEVAAMAVVHLASSPMADGANGRYFDQGKLATPAPAAEDDAVVERLWAESARLSGLAA